jgi:hypothetical protein
MSARPDHERQASGRLKLNAQFPYLLKVRSDQAGWKFGRLYLNCDSCLMYESVRKWIHVVRTVASNFPYLNLERKFEADRSLKVIWTGCWVVRTDASWNRSFSIHRRVPTEIHVVRTDDAWSVGVRAVWHVVRMDGTVDRWASGRDDTSSGRLARNRLFWLQNLLKYFWIAESLVKQHLLQTSDFVQIEWGQSQTNSGYPEFGCPGVVFLLIEFLLR